MMKPVLSTGLRWLWLVLVVIAIDFASKQWIMNTLMLHESMAVMPFFNFFYAHNYGAAFSFLADKGGWQRWFFAGIAVAIVIALVVMMYRTEASKKLNNIAYALIIGGALGNLFDRAYHGFVVDFIDFYVGDWHFATFNVADCAICIGAALIVLEGFLSPAGKHAKS
ncbi:lipoprotein signal peptidase [Erwinia endophytica]|uniref:signal peptidase II n=1 Tax=Erwinia endophytica TaxID=1563158 RepID=UPI001265DB6A|nr:signal peptidase II [Erwinia endophytica]KAB8306148.1 lipoprotein signal peptidase [Erwinia endophytica]